MKRILILVAISLFLCSTTPAQGGGGESTKKGSIKKAVTKKNSEIKSNKTTPTRRPPPQAQFVLVLGPALSINLGNNVKLELVRINAGSFEMGSDKSDDEKPVHRVNITKSFYLGKYEVTQAQWEALMGSNPSYFKDCGGNCPVEQVSWNDAQSFINKLNESNYGFKYRLPTESEWEYACRAGTTGDYAGNLIEMAWYFGNAGRATQAVGGKQPNAWGLADMHGNVWEWCQDWYHETYYRAPSDGSAWLSDGEQKYRVLRGGSWDVAAAGLRSASRGWDAPVARGNFGGFRVVAVGPTQSSAIVPTVVVEFPTSGRRYN